MTDRLARFGVDLRLLDDLTFQNDRVRGSDLATVRRPETGAADIETLAGAENLRQALLLRFLTPTGELAQLGHADYGSRLHELIGELNTEATRNRAKLYTLQALAAEPRVRQVRSISVKARASDRTRIDIEVSLVTIDSDTPLNLVFPFFL